MSLVTLRCTCGASERIHASRPVAAGWTDRSYTCLACARTEASAEETAPDFAALQREPVAGNLARALAA